MKFKSLNLQRFSGKLSPVLNNLKRYRVLIFLVFIGILYGFLLLRVGTLGNSEPSALEVSSQVKAARVPHIDQSTVDQLESLQDNSVSVQALFDEARSNPFQ